MPGVVFFLPDAETRRRHSDKYQAPPVLSCQSAKKIHARKPKGASCRVRERCRERERERERERGGNLGVHEL